MAEVAAMAATDERLDEFHKRMREQDSYYKRLQCAVCEKHNITGYDEADALDQLYEHQRGKEHKRKVRWLEDAAAWHAR